jgi:ectoine hydroxylase-related dioxygenase (phytanoyl-CoA dioxygenase family)
MNDTKDSILQNGFSIIPHFFSDIYTDEIIEELNKHKALQYDKHVVSDFNLINSIPFVRSLAYGSQLKSLADLVLGDTSFPINAFVLDKTQDSNWGLDWHQDLKNAVKNKIETPGYSNWTVEYGISHVIPPKEVLEKRLSVRIHLDDCLIDNGAILVAPESHKKGIIQDATDIDEITSGETLYCEVKKGGVMFMTPLLLHKSPYSTTNRKRRVLQIDYAGIKLINGLDWL